MATAAAVQCMHSTLVTNVQGKAQVIASAPAVTVCNEDGGGDNRSTSGHRMQ